MTSSLHQLLQRPDVWRPRDQRPLIPNARNRSTGFSALDRELHGGWPSGALTEFLLAQPGSGELFLLTPLLAELSKKQLLTVWINPPFIPYAPALAQRNVALESLLIVRGESQHHLWACEQALRNTACGCVLYWPAKSLRYAELRKLQVAAATQNAAGFLFRDQRAVQQTSPAVLRLQLKTIDAPPLNTQLAIHIVKQRGHTAGQTLFLPREEFLSCQEFLHNEFLSHSEKSAQPSIPARPAQCALKIIATDSHSIVHAATRYSSSAAAPH